MFQDTPVGSQFAYNRQPFSAVNYHDIGKVLRKKYRASWSYRKSHGRASGRNRDLVNGAINTDMEELKSLPLGSPEATVRGYRYIGCARRRFCSEPLIAGVAHGNGYPAYVAQ